MRNRRLMFHAFSVLILGAGLLLSGSVGAASVPSQGCFVCNYGCPSKKLRNQACRDKCGSDAQDRGCFKGCDGGTHFWLCEDAPA